MPQAQGPCSRAKYHAWLLGSLLMMKLIEQLESAFQHGLVGRRELDKLEAVETHWVIEEIGHW
jgi:hypothetical protein